MSGEEGFLAVPEVGFNGGLSACRKILRRNFSGRVVADVSPVSGVTDVTNVTCEAHEYGGVGRFW